MEYSCSRISVTDAIYIDGSQGEGGGQMIRSSLALALVSGRCVTIDRIRAGRAKPGLMQQHLTAVNAAVEICGGSVSGAAIGSRSITFGPQPVQPGDYHFRVGTAGSATLVLQTVLPALLLADGPTNLLLEGGTHNPWAPPFDFLEKSFLPLVNRMGPHVSAELERRGFYPAGGGRFRVHIEPADRLCGFDLLERGEIVARRARILLANLPAHIARRELATSGHRTGWESGSCQVEEVQSGGAGNGRLLELESEHVTEIFTGIGRQGVKAEKVAGDAVRKMLEYVEADVPVGKHLADQLLLPLGISAWHGKEQSAQGDAGVSSHTGGSVSLLGCGVQVARGRESRPKGGTPAKASRPGGAFRTLVLSGHATTHIDLLRQFLGVTISIEESGSHGACTVRVG